MAPDDLPTARLGRVNVAVSTTPRAARLVPLLFGLGLATALPPAAMLAPPDAIQPTIRFDTYPILDAADLSTILARSAADVGHGHIALSEVDVRLLGLAAWVSVFRVADGAGVGSLVSVGIVTPDPTADDGSATVADLWKLACAALAQHAIPSGHLDGLGDDAFLAVHDGTTAQVAWLDGVRLTTASVTCLAGDEHWAIAAAHSIAALLERRHRR